MKDFIEINVPKDHPAANQGEITEDSVFFDVWKVELYSFLCPYVCGSEDELCCHNNNPSKRCKEHDCPIRVCALIQVMKMHSVFIIKHAEH